MLGGIIVRNFISVFVYKVIDGCEYDAARSSTVLVFTYTWAVYVLATDTSANRFLVSGPAATLQR